MEFNAGSMADRPFRAGWPASGMMSCMSCKDGLRPIVACFVLLACLGLSGCQQAYFKALNAATDDELALTRSYDREHGLALDVYRPQGVSGPAPVLVFLHGGSWQRGRREYYRFVGEALAARGVLVLVPDYRKAPAHPFPSFVEDAAAATAWAHANAASYGGDPGRIFLMGHSAGAHMAALVATDASYLRRWGLEPRNLAGVIGLAGPYDFQPEVNPRIGRRVFWSVREWPRTQPVHYVDGDEPPFLLMHGDRDRMVWVDNSRSLARRLRDQGEPVELRILPGIGHVGLVNGFYSPRFSPALAETLSWMKKSQPAAVVAGRLASPQ